MGCKQKELYGESCNVPCGKCADVYGPSAPHKSAEVQEAVNFVMTSDIPQVVRYRKALGRALIDVIHANFAPVDNVGEPKPCNCGKGKPSCTCSAPLPSDAREPVRCPFCGDDIPEGFKHHVDGSHPCCVVVPRVPAPSDDARECARHDLTKRLGLLPIETSLTIPVIQKLISWALSQNGYIVSELVREARRAPSPTGNAEGVK